MSVDGGDKKEKEAAGLELAPRHFSLKRIFWRQISLFVPSIMSSASSSDSDTESLPAVLSQPPAPKTKGRKSASGGAKDEGTDPNWAYQPPPNAVLCDSASFTQNPLVDWDAINSNDDNELWLIRIPAGVSLD